MKTNTLKIVLLLAVALAFSQAQANKTITGAQGIPGLEAQRQAAERQLTQNQAKTNQVRQKQTQLASQLQQARSQTQAAQQTATAKNQAHATATTNYDNAKTAVENLSDSDDASAKQTATTNFNQAKTNLTKATAERNQANQKLEQAQTKERQLQQQARDLKDTLRNLQVAAKHIKENRLKPTQEGIAGIDKREDALKKDDGSEGSSTKAGEEAVSEATPEDAHTLQDSPLDEQTVNLGALDLEDARPADIGKASAESASPWQTVTKDSLPADLQEALKISGGLPVHHDDGNIYFANSTSDDGVTMLSAEKFEQFRDYQQALAERESYLSPDDDGVVSREKIDSPEFQELSDNVFAAAETFGEQALIDSEREFKQTVTSMDRIGVLASGNGIYFLRDSVTRDMQVMDIQAYRDNVQAINDFYKLPPKQQDFSKLTRDQRFLATMDWSSRAVEMVEGLAAGDSKIQAANVARGIGELDASINAADLSPMQRRVVEKTITSALNDQGVQQQLAGAMRESVRSLGQTYSHLTGSRPGPTGLARLNPWSNANQTLADFEHLGEKFGNFQNIVKRGAFVGPGGGEAFYKDLLSNQQSVQKLVSNVPLLNQEIEGARNTLKFGGAMLATAPAIPLGVGLLPLSLIAGGSAGLISYGSGDTVREAATQAAIATGSTFVGGRLFQSASWVLSGADDVAMAVGRQKALQTAMNGLSLSRRAGVLLRAGATSGAATGMVATGADALAHGRKLTAGEVLYSGGAGAVFGSVMSLPAAIPTSKLLSYFPKGRQTPSGGKPVGVGAPKAGTTRPTTTKAATSGSKPTLPDRNFETIAQEYAKAYGVSSEKARSILAPLKNELNRLHQIGGANPSPKDIAQKARGLRQVLKDKGLLAQSDNQGWEQAKQFIRGSIKQYGLGHLPTRHNAQLVTGRNPNGSRSGEYRGRQPVGKTSGARPKVRTASPQPRPEPSLTVKKRTDPGKSFAAKNGQRKNGFKTAEDGSIEYPGRHNEQRGHDGKSKITPATRHHSQEPSLLAKTAHTTQKSPFYERKTLNNLVEKVRAQDASSPKVAQKKLSALDGITGTPTRTQGKKIIGLKRDLERLSNQGPEGQRMVGDFLSALEAKGRVRPSEVNKLLTGLRRETVHIRQELSHSAIITVSPLKAHPTQRRVAAQRDAFQRSQKQVKTMPNIEERFDVLARKTDQLNPSDSGTVPIHEVDVALASDGIPSRFFSVSPQGKIVAGTRQSDKVFAVGHKGALQFTAANGRLSGKAERYYAIVLPKGFLKAYGANVNGVGVTGNMPKAAEFARKWAPKGKAFAVRYERATRTDGQVHLRYGEGWDRMKVGGRHTSQEQFIRDHVVGVVEFDAAGKIISVQPVRQQSSR